MRLRPRPIVDRQLATEGSPQLDARWLEREQALAEFARAHHNVLSIGELRELGFADSTVAHRARVGRLHRKYRGVYAYGRPDLSQKGKWRAAIVACGEGAVLSHVSAAALHGIRVSFAAAIHVTVPRSSPPGRHGIRAHRAELTDADVTMVDGIPVTSFARTLLDLATMLDDGAVERAANEAEVCGLFDLRAIEELLPRSRGHRGVRRLRRVLEKGDLSGENVPASGLEIRYAELCARAGLPRPDINRWVLLGEEYLKVDFLWREAKVVIETDGSRYHRSGWKRRRDAARDRLLAEHGFLAGRVGESTIANDPIEAVNRARRLLACRESI